MTRRARRYGFRICSSGLPCKTGRNRFQIDKNALEEETQFNRFERIQNASFGNVSNASYQFVTFRRYNATLHGWENRIFLQRYAIDGAGLQKFGAFCLDFKSLDLSQTIAEINSFPWQLNNSRHGWRAVFGRQRVNHALQYTYLPIVGEP